MGSDGGGIGANVTSKVTNCGEVPSLHYKYIMTFCVLPFLKKFSTPAPQTSWVRTTDSSALT